MSLRWFERDRRRTLYGVAAGVLVVLAIVSSVVAARRTPDPTVILISIDGFRWDFLDRADTPNLDRLVSAGVRAERLVPVFPTLTFPNHYTMVTGLYPAHHGIVANTMYDPNFDAWFRISDDAAVGDGRWWGGEPVWVTAEKQGRPAASFFWPGSEAEIAGRRPTYWKRYDEEIQGSERVRQVLVWLDQPAAARPRFITLYFEDVDHANHDSDPSTSPPEIAAAIRQVDGYVGQLLAGLDSRNLAVDIIIVSDHGIVARSPERVIFLDDYIDLDVAGIVDWHPVAALRPDSAAVDEVFRQLVDAHPHLEVYRAEGIPDRFRYSGHPRVTPILAIADEGWSITSRSYYARNRHRLGFGSHGYDHELRTMGALFLAAGPSFRENVTVPPFQNVHLYSLICHILGLDAAPNDGTIDSVRVLLRSQ